MPYPPIKWTRKWRLAFMISLIVIFLVSAPAIIFYTAGYRYDWDKGEVQKTGVISIKAQPKNAKVFLNGVKLDKELPMRLSNRAPGTYQLKISKQGYHTWQKNIEVNSKKTTYVNYIQLLKNTLPIKLDLNLNFDKIKQVKISPHHPYIIAVIKEKNFYELKLIDLEQKEITNLARTSEVISPPKVAWHNTRPYAYIKLNKKDNNIIQLVSGTEQKIGKAVNFSNDQQKNLQWTSSYQPSLVVNKKNELIKINLTEKNKITTTTNKKVWYYDNNRKNLWQYDRSNNRLKLKEGDSFLQLSSGIEKIIYLDKDKIIAKNSDHFIIFSRNKNKVTNKQTLSAKKITKIDSKWIAYSPWQFWRIYPDGSVDLMTRSSQKIHSINKLEKIESRNNLLLKKEGQLKSFDPRYYVNHTLFKRGKQIEDTGVNFEQRKIYLYGKIGNKTGVFYLEY
jgi:hypothetical protein